MFGFFPILKVDLLHLSRRCSVAYDSSTMVTRKTLPSRQQRLQKKPSVSFGLQSFAARRAGLPTASSTQAPKNQSYPVRPRRCRDILHLAAPKFLTQLPIATNWSHFDALNCHTTTSGVVGDSNLASLKTCPARQLSQKHETPSKNEGVSMSLCIFEVVGAR